MRRLSITNGDGAADIIKRSAVVGDVLPWRDPMHHGPFPADLDLADVSEIRARYLVGPESDATEALRDFRLRNEHLRAFADYDTVVLWFEHDLLDQLQILQILDWFNDADLGATALEMICIDSFPDIPIFRGIGQLDAGQMASLFPLRSSVTAETLELATRGWAAFRSDDPRDILAFLDGDLSALPFLAKALRRHLEEFPSVSSGLTRTELQLLGLAARGVANPSHLFVQNMDLETELFIGDWPTFRVIARLCDGGLLGCEPSPFVYPAHTMADPRDFPRQVLHVTRVGQEVLNGTRDAFDLINRDDWLGGLHNRSDKGLWVWDPAGKLLQRPLE